jgi:hypothetical protein
MTKEEIFFQLAAFLGFRRTQVNAVNSSFLQRNQNSQACDTLPSWDWESLFSCQIVD